MMATVGYTSMLVALALALAVGPESALAQSQTWQARTDAAYVLYGQGRYAEAEAAFRAALEEAGRLGPRDFRLALSLDNLAEFYRGQGAYGRSEALHRRALVVKQETLGPDDPSVADTLGSLAELHRATGAYAEAEALYRRALAIYERALGAEHVRLAVTFNNLALIYAAQGRYGEAEGLYRRALAILDKAGDDSSRAVVRRNYTRLLQRMEREAASAQPEASAEAVPGTTSGERTP